MNRSLRDFCCFSPGASFWRLRAHACLRSRLDSLPSFCSQASDFCWAPRMTRLSTPSMTLCEHTVNALCLFFGEVTESVSASPKEIGTLWQRILSSSKL